VAGYTASFFVSGLLGLLLVISMSGAALPKGLKVGLTMGISYGWPVYVSTIVGAVVAPVLTTALALTVTNSQIGGYSAAGTFTTLITLFTYPVGTALFPLFSGSVSDVSALGGAYRASVKFTALLVLPVCFFMVALANPLIVTFYGHSYSFGGYLLALFAAMNLLAGVGNLSWGAFLNGIGRTRDALIANAMSSVVDIGVGIPLILAVGVGGAIFGQIAGGAVGLVIGMWMVVRQLHVDLGLRSVWKLWLSAGVAAVVCYPISWLVHIPQLAVVLGAAAFVILFVTIMAGIRALTAEDINALRGYLGFSSVVSRLVEVAIRYYEFVGRLACQSLG
jgi:O-antigen/teichoic acid export membrane protein